MAKKGLLIVSFGTSDSNMRKHAIEKIEKQLAACFLDRVVYCAFTSDVIREIIWKKEGVKILNVQEALGQMVKDGIIDVLIQPIFSIEGIEYNKMLMDIQQKGSQLTHIFLGKPLLDKREDYIAAVQAVMDEIKSNISFTKHTAVICIGHGSKYDETERYVQLQKTFQEMGYDMVYVVTIEKSSNFLNTLHKIKQNKYDTVVLCPFMIVAGSHIKKCMTNTESNSWKNQLERQGFEVICIRKGLGELKAIGRLFCLHAEKAISE